MSIRITDNCKNLLDSYGEICVHCNRCGRFDLICNICGHRSKPRYFKFWERVECIDKFRVLVCPKCKRNIPNNFYVKDDYSNDVILESFEDLKNVVKDN